MALFIPGTGVAGYSGNGGPADSAMLHDPENVAIDSCGNLYITDLQNKRIRKVTFNDSCGILNVKQVKPLTFTLFPNPATTQITISSANKLKEIYVYSIMGQQVLWQGSASDKVIMDMEGLPPGVYFVKVRDVNGAQRTEKIIKQ